MQRRAALASGHKPDKTCRSLENILNTYLGRSHISLMSQEDLLVSRQEDQCRVSAAFWWRLYRARRNT